MDFMKHFFRTFKKNTKKIHFKQNFKNIEPIYNE